MVATEFAGNELEAGAWVESNEVRLRRPHWRLVDYARGPKVDFENVLRLDFDRTGEIGTRMLYVQNTNRLLDDRLRLTYGVLTSSTLQRRRFVGTPRPDLRSHLPAVPVPPVLRLRDPMIALAL